MSHTKFQANENHRSSSQERFRVRIVAIMLFVTTSIILSGCGSRLGEGSRKDVVPAESERQGSALWHLGTNDWRPRGSIRDLVVSPDGRLIATAGDIAVSPHVWLFDVSTGREVKQIAVTDGPPGQIACLAISRDGSTMLWGEHGGYVALWDLANDQLLFRKPLHRGKVTDVSFAHARKLFASAGEEGIVQVREIQNPARPFRELILADQPDATHESGGESAVEPHNLVFTPDDRHVIVGGRRSRRRNDRHVWDETISIWMVSDGGFVRRIVAAESGPQAHQPAQMNSLAITADGRQIMSASSRLVPIEETSLEYGSKFVRMSEVRLWDFVTGEKVRVLHNPEAHGSGYASLSPDGQWVAIGDYSRLRFVDAKTGAAKLTVTLPGWQGNEPQFSPDGCFVAIRIGKMVAVYDVQTGERLRHTERTPDGSLISVAWSPEGDRIVTGHADGEIRVWDAMSGDLLWHRLLAPVISRLGWNASPRFVSFTSDGQRIVVAGRRDDPIKHETGIVAVYNADNGDLVRAIPMREVRGAALSTDDSLLVVATSNGNNSDTHLHGIDLPSGRELYMTPAEDVRPALPANRAMRFRQDTTLLDVAFEDGTFIAFDGRTGEEQHRFIADWSTGEEITAPRKRRRGFATGAFTTDGRTLVSSWREHLLVWDVEARTLRQEMLHSRTNGCHISVSSDGETIATSERRYGSRFGENTIRLHDVETGNEVMRLEPDENRARLMAFSPDGTKLFTGYRRGSATVWDVRR